MTVKTNEKTWLITGGTGFIGQALIADLDKLNHRVIALSRNPDRARTVLPAQVAIIQDLEEIASNQSIDVVVNLAGEPLFGGLWTKKRKQAFFDSRLSTTRGLVALMNRLSTMPAVMVSGSAIGFYGMSADADFNEDSPKGTDEMATLCHEWEQAAMPAANHGIRLILLRTGLVMDPAGGMLKPLMLSSKLCLGSKLGDGQQWMSWITRRDLIRLIFFAVNNPEIKGPLNAVARRAVTQETFINALAKKLSRPRILRAPGAILKILLGDMAPMLLQGQKVLPDKATKAGFIFETADIEDAFD